MPLFLVGKAGLEARRLSVEGLSPFHRSAEISTMVPLNGPDTNGSRPLAAKHYRDYECGMGGASGTPVALSTRGGPTTECWVGNSMVRAQRGARLVAVAPYVIVPIRHWTSTLSSGAFKEALVPPSPC